MVSEEVVYILTRAIIDLERIEAKERRSRIRVFLNLPITSMRKLLKYYEDENLYEKKTSDVRSRRKMA